MFRPLSKLVCFCTFALAALVPARAMADQIDFTGLGHASVVSIGGIRTGSFYAGELNWMWVGTPPEGFAQSFYSYCVDVSQNLRDPQTVSVRSTEGFTNGAADGGAKAAWLVNQYAQTVRQTANVATANILAAGLQVAIWEAMYDTVRDLTVGNFQLTGASLSNGVRNQADVYLTALYTNASLPYNTSVATLVEVASPNLGQDQIVSRVSEPSTLLLMGVAFLLFANRFRRSGVEPASN